MKKIYILCSFVLLSFAASAQCTELFISEYAEGSSSNKYLELYNPTSSAIDLSGYSLFMINNGGTSNDIGYNLTGMLAANEVYVIANDAANATILAAADTALSYNSVVHFNGNDCVLLLKGTDTIDQIGQRWEAVYWTVGSGSTSDYTLVRKFTIEGPDTAWASTSIMGWDVLPKDDWSNIGSHSSACYPPLLAEVSFASSTMEVDENEGTATIEVTVTNASATDTTKVEVSVTGGSAVITTDYAITSSVMLEFLPGSSISQTVSMSIVDNSTADGNKTVELDLSNVSSNASIGDNSSLIITIVDDEYKVADIADAINLDGDLAATNEGSKFELTGVVYGGDLDGNAGISFTIIDATGGMNIFNFRDVNDYVVTEGDEITVRGEIDFYNGLLELFADSILVNSSGNTLKSATQVEAPSEATESDFIVLRKVWITNDTTTLWPDNQNVELTNEDMDTFQIRIDRDIPGIVGMPVEFDTMTITGLGGQFDGSAPYNEGYQIFPRGLSDIAEYVDRSSVTESVIETRVYPNPTSNNLTVIGTQKWDTYRVFNILGGIVLEGSLSNNNLTVSELNTGTYIVKLYAGENTGVARFVVNR